MTSSIPREVEASWMDRAKDLIRRVLWALPTPLSILAYRVGCNAGWFNKIFLIYDKLGRPPRVLSGPFRGMIFLPLSRGSTPLPKILGTYEKELHPIFDRMAEEPCDVIVDIGSAEGFYAIGLLRLLDAPKVYCFDIDLLAQRILLRMARANGLADRVVRGGFCRPFDLQTILAGASHPVVICDCEGGEIDLLDLQMAPDLRKARVLVEVHDYDGAHSIGDELQRRFAVTHEIEAIGLSPRSLEDLPEGCRSILNEQEGRLALAEARGQVPGWLFLRPIAA